MSLLKKFSKDILGYGLGVAVTKSLGLISLPLITAFFSVEQIGVLELCLALSAIAILFILLGIDTGLTYFYWNNNDIYLRKSYIATSFSIIIITSAFLSILLYLLQGVLNEFYFNLNTDSFYGLVILSIISQSFFLLSNKILRIKRIVFKYNVVIVVNAVSFVAFLLIFLSNEPKIENFFISKIISFFLAFLLCLYFIKSSLNARPNFSRAKELVKYSIPLVPFAVTATLMGVLDKVFINYYMDLSDVGLFSVGAKLGASIVLLITAFSMAFGPFAMSIQNKENAKEVYSKIFLAYFSFMLLSVLAITAIDSYAVKIITQKEEVYFDSIAVIGPTALSLVIHSLFSQLGIGLNLTKNNKYFFYGSMVALVVNAVFNPILIPIFGIVGASYASVISYLIITLWVYFISSKKYPIPYSINSIIYISIIFSFSFFCITNFLEHSETILRFIVLAVYIVLVCPLVFIKLKKS